MSEKKLLLGLCILFVVVNIILFAKSGIRIVGDSSRFLGYANGLERGLYFDPHNFWYISYCLFILINNIAGLGTTGIVIGQYVFSLIGLILLYRASLMLWNERASAVFTCCLVIMFSDWSLWNSYILAESLYTTLVCFCIYGSVLIDKGSRKVGVWVAMGVLVVFTSLIKPTGISVFLAGMAFLVYPMLMATRIRPWIRYASIFCLGLIAGVCANRMLVTYNVMENYQLGEVIYYSTRVEGYVGMDWFIVTPPSDLWIPREGQPVIKILSFIWHNPYYWLKLSAAKVFYLFFHCRPYWSLTHNLVAIVILLPTYFCSILGFFFLSRRIAFSMGVFLLVHILSIGFTSGDWDNRFLIPVLPVIFFMAGKGINECIKRLVISYRSDQT